MTSTSSTSTVWMTWTDNSATSTTTCDGAWSSWNTGTSTSTTTCNYTWVTWVSGCPGHVVSVASNKEAIADRKDIEARAKAREEERKIAEKRAKDLLFDLIGEKEFAVYEKTGRLFVKGNKFDYIVQKQGFIKRIEKKKITDLCVHLENRYKYPATDNVVSMKLLIENEENRMLKLANNHGSRKLPEKLPLAACM